MDRTDRNRDDREAPRTGRPGAGIWIVAILGVLIIVAVLWFAFSGDGGIGSEPQQPRIDLPGGEPVDGGGAGANG